MREKRKSEREGGRWGKETETYDRKVFWRFFLQ